MCTESDRLEVEMLESIARPHGFEKKKGDPTVTERARRVGRAHTHPPDARDADVQNEKLIWSEIS